MSTQHIGNENANIRNHGGGSFDKGLGVPIRDTVVSVPKFEQSITGKQISINPVTLRLEVWNSSTEKWMDPTHEIAPKAFKSDAVGIISDPYLVTKNVVSIIGAGSVLVGGSTSEPGYEFVKALGDSTITVLNGSLAADTYYTLIFGE